MFGGRRGRRRAPRRRIRPTRILNPFAFRRYRRRRRIIRRTRRILFGSAILFAVAGSRNNYKFNQNEVSQIENYYGKPAEDLTEAEIVHAMRNLGIKKIDLSEEEEFKINEEVGEE